MAGLVVMTSNLLWRSYENRSESQNAHVLDDLILNKRIQETARKMLLTRKNVKALSGVSRRPHRLED